MIVQRSTRLMHIGLLAIAISFTGPMMIGFAQVPDDLYQSGPDPIAPTIANPSAKPATEGQNVEQKSSEKNGKDDLDMLDMNLKELSQVAVKPASSAMNAEVSTVSRTESTVGRSPAAVYVITNEMIRRSGARNIPDVLRLAPGVNVAQINAHSWAISIRGFNAQYANKLLVQIDGRAVYTPGTAGVNWDQQQLLLEDIERIEVIRGPGGAVWGANAVNGIINIITKSSIDTKGIYVYSGGGTEHRSFNAVRVGGQQGDLHWRLYGMQNDDGPTWSPSDALDAWQFGQGGFHLDWTPTHRDTLTFQGDFLKAREIDALLSLTQPTNVNATNFLGRWTRKLDEDRDWAVQMYYDDYKCMPTETDPRVLCVNTFDLDAQYHAKLGSRHDVVCGFGYRDYESIAAFPGIFTFVPPYDTFDIISYFVQDTIELRPERVFLTAGIKLQHNDFTNFEYQPSVRLLVMPNDRTVMWGAISRAVRTPSIADRDTYFTGYTYGSRNVRSEDVLAYELGMRRQPTDRLYWDLAVFFNRYENLVGVTPAFPVFPEFVSNVGRGDTYGFELAATYEVTPDWQLRGSYSFLVEDIDYPANTTAFFIYPGLSPRNQCFLQSGWNLSRNTKLDMIWRYVDNLPAGNPHYLVMDIRLAHEFSNGMEAAIVGQNLLDNHHGEFTNYGTISEVQSGVYGMLSWTY
ncbi:MAG: TonB-dependent receptor [Pirellulales bacterium]|nr:TonB-dependent receptor [Pirellulales bacterium]